jgi:4-hydroxyphenylpyruvate dioxygenase-like putative hemolysin
VLTTPLKSDSPINEHIVKHGDGVKVIALWVEDARSSWKKPQNVAPNLLWNQPLKKMNMVK